MAIDFVAASVEYLQATGYKGILGTNPRTVSAWIKTTALNATILSWGVNAKGEKWVFRVQDDAGIAGATRIEVNSGYVVGDVAVNDGEWHHVGVVWEDNGTPEVLDALLYVDGVLVASSAANSQVINTTSGDDVKIGVRGPDGDDLPFDGLIDDARIYARALSAAEMAALHAQRGADGIVYGLVSRWRMDEASPGTVVSGAGVVKDDVGDNHATPVATPEYAKSELSRKRAA